MKRKVTVLALLTIGLFGIVIVVNRCRYDHSLLVARELVLRENLWRIRHAIGEHKKDLGCYPPTLQSLVQSRHLRAIPFDPITDSPSTWRLEYSDDESASTCTGRGVIDISSGARARALDGTLYVDW